MLLLAVLILAGCGSTTSGATEVEEKKVLTMGTSADYPPFEYIDTAKGGDIIGFDVDLANAIAGKLGYEFEIKDMDFGGLISALQSDKVDFVLAGMSATEERKQNVDFSDVYYTAKDMIISQAGSGIETEEDLNGKTIGVQLGSIQEDYGKELQKEYPDLQVESRDRISELVQEVKNGRFDAAVIDVTVATGFLEENDDLGGFIAPADDEGAGSAMAFPKGSELTEAFNAELQKMKENGELDALIEEWFGKENE